MATSTTSTRAATGWVVALTGIGSLMAALDTLVVSSALQHHPARPAALASSSSSGR